MLARRGLGQLFRFYRRIRDEVNRRRVYPKATGVNQRVFGRHAVPIGTGRVPRQQFPHRVPNEPEHLGFVGTMTLSSSVNSTIAVRNRITVVGLQNYELINVFAKRLLPRRRSVASVLLSL